jgi:8-oxo-dGTP pyrophosphatase MutT (NUDIX family)
MDVFMQYHRRVRAPLDRTQEKSLSHKTRTVFEGQVVRLGIESLTLPNGEPLELEIVRHPGGAAVVALDEDRRVCLLRQYRHAAGGWLWELPAGKLEKEEEPQATAARELAEEAGLRAGQWHRLGTVLTTPGFCDESIHLYLVEQLSPVTAQQERHELIEIHWLPFTRAIEQVHDGTIHDAKTMLGLLLAETRIRS